jgi:hypothetical protein
MRSVTPVWGIAALTAALSLTPLSAGAAPEATAQSSRTDSRDATVTTLGFLSDAWSYSQVSGEGDPGFSQKSYDDSSWSTGRAGFGTTSGPCSWNTSRSVKTSWSPGSTLLLRHSFRIPEGARAVHIGGAVDATADVYLNGSLLRRVSPASCQEDGIDIDVPASALLTDNLLALRAHSDPTSSYVDVRITYTVTRTWLDHRA